MKRFTGFNHFFNEPLGNLSVGSILTRKSGWSSNFTVSSHIFRSINKKKEDYTNIGNKQHHFFYSKSSIAINLGADLSNSLNETEASISFANKNNAVIIIKDGITTDLFFDDLQDDLEKLWYKRKYNQNANNTFLVTSVIVSNKAKVFYSTQNNTSVRLKHKNNIPIIQDLDLLNAEFSFGKKRDTVEMKDIHNKCTVLFKVVRWRNRKERFVVY